MNRFRSCVAAAVAVALVGGAWLVAEGPSTPSGQPPASATPAQPAPSPSRPPSEAPAPRPAPPTTQAAGPPRGTSGIALAYLSRYHARRVDWDDVLAHGHRLPEPSARCEASWKKSGLDSRLASRRGQHWCLDGLPGGHWKPQGVTGSGSAEGYAISGHAAQRRNLVLTSWYSPAAERGLFAPNEPGQSVTRLVVLDLDRQRYGIVELVRPQGKDRLRNLNSHGSGLAWSGQYLYSSSRSWLWRYNADDLLQIGGHFVLPAVTRWSVAGAGGLSSLSVDRWNGRRQLLGVNYATSGPTYVHTFDLGRRGQLPSHARPATGPSLQLTTRFGEKHRVLSSISSTAVPGTHVQGVGRWGRYTFLSSSSLRIRAGAPRTDAMVVLRDHAVRQRFQLPEGNVESVYVDRRRKSYVSVTEAGSQFLFTLPLRGVIKAAAG